MKSERLQQVEQLYHAALEHSESERGAFLDKRMLGRPDSSESMNRFCALKAVASGEAIKLGSEYNGNTLTPQTLSSVIWRHFLHPEDKSLSPNGEFCNPYTRGLLLRRPITAIKPLIPIGKEIERRSQEGEDISVLDNVGPVRYHPRKTANTRPADAALIQRASRFPKKLLRRESGASQHAIDRFFRGERIHPGTRKKLAQTVEELERSGQL